MDWPWQGSINFCMFVMVACFGITFSVLDVPKNSISIRSTIKRANDSLTCWRSFFCPAFRFQSMFLRVDDELLTNFMTCRQGVLGGWGSNLVILHQCFLVGRKVARRYQVPWHPCLSSSCYLSSCVLQLFSVIWYWRRFMRQTWRVLRIRKSLTYRQWDVVV